MKGASGLQSGKMIAEPSENALQIGIEVETSEKVPLLGFCHPERSAAESKDDGLLIEWVSQRSQVKKAS